MTIEPGTSVDRRWLLGLIPEFGELTRRLLERQQLLVIESDPLSGTSLLLAAAIQDASYDALSVDAGPAGDAGDLAIATAASAVGHFAPAALGWWNSGRPIDADGQRLAHTMWQRGIDLELIRSPSATGEDRLRRAIELVGELSTSVLLVIDHLDDLLEKLRTADGDSLLGVLRTQLQARNQVQQVLVGRTAGRLASALDDAAHPLYRAGGRLAIRRPSPQRFIEDLHTAGLQTPVSLLGAAAELAAGAPGYVWRIVDAAVEDPGVDPRDRALIAWRELRELTSIATAQQFALTGSVHRWAPTVLSALALGTRPYELPLNPKSISDALTRLRAVGQVFSPAKQRWAVSDPALAAWARGHAPPSLIA
jgi:hypothetical protein